MTLLDMDIQSQLLGGFADYSQRFTSLGFLSLGFLTSFTATLLAWLLSRRPRESTIAKAGGWSSRATTRWLRVGIFIMLALATSLSNTFGTPNDTDLGVCDEGNAIAFGSNPAGFLPWIRSGAQTASGGWLIMVKVAGTNSTLFFGSSIGIGC